MARWNIQEWSNHLSGDSELRAHENRARQMQMINGQLVANQDSSGGGISARHFHNGAWGFASMPSIGAEAAGRVVAQAGKNAKLLAKRVTAEHRELPPPNAKGDKRYIGQKKRLSSEELLDFMNRVDTQVKLLFPELKSRQVVLMQQEFEKELLTTSGAHCYSLMARSYVHVIMGMDSANGPVELRETFGGLGTFEETLPTDKHHIDEKLQETYRHLKNKASGVAARAGVAEVILDSKLAGILAHEAIGHTTEADLVLGGSVAGEFLGKSVASPLVGLVDFAHTALGEPCPLPVHFDDEGIEAQDTIIIENGVLKNFMHSRESAAHFGHRATGHARAWGFNDEPLIRMRNTAILPGASRLEDMIASVDDGYYLIDHGNGQADSTSEFMFSVPLGYEIKKGKIGRALLDTTISGVAFDMLKTVTQVSNEMTWVSSGTCGKKQPMTVGMGGPAIKCRVSLGGR